MNIKNILTEAGLDSIGEETLAKIESAVQAELATAVKAESDRNSKKFGSLMEALNAKFDEKISRAVTESVAKMKSDAISSKMYETLKEMANLLEGVGIPCTELSKKLTEEMAEANRKLQEDYAARERLKKELNQDYKMRLVDALTAGCHPSVIQAARAYFKDKDIREINKDTVAQVIRGDIEPSYPHDTDPDVGGSLNMDKIDAALNEISDTLDLDAPGYDQKPTGAQAEQKRKNRYESIGNGLRAERVRIPKGMMEAVSAETMDADVGDAMRQMEAYGELGLGGKFA